MYHVETYSEAVDQIASLPDEALAFYAQALGVLELVPWNGLPYNKTKSHGAVRQLVFGSDGQGVVVNLILEDQQRVDVVRVVWLS